MHTQTFNKEELSDTIKQALPKDAVPLMISVAGSRAKGLAGDSSDFDVKAIVMYPTKSYLLQRASPTCRINTEYNGVEVEGTCIDILQALKWVVDTNPAIYDALHSIMIFETEIVDKLKELFVEAYSANRLRMALAGQIKAYTRVKKMGENRPTAVFKMATEAAYLALKCKFVCLFPAEIPPFDINDLIERVGGEDSDMIKKLVSDRIADKNGEYTKSKEYINFIAGAEDLSEQVKSKMSSDSKKELSAKTQLMQAKSEEIFLSLVTEPSS